MSYMWNTQKAIDFARMASEFELWAHSEGYYLVRGWAKRNQGIQKEIYGGERPTYHEWSRAQDYTLFIVNEAGQFIWIEDGSHSAWKTLADKAEEIGLKTGRNWNDINHIENPQEVIMPCKKKGGKRKGGKK